MILSDLVASLIGNIFKLSTPWVPCAISGADEALWDRSSHIVGIPTPAQVTLYPVDC
jgi:hypothetical protein